MATAVRAEIWSRIVSPKFERLTPDVAREILRFKLKKTDLDRVRKLSMMSQKGTLTEEQRGELQLYLQIGELLTLMHSKARVALRPRESGPRRKSA